MSEVKVMRQRQRASSELRESNTSTTSMYGDTDTPRSSIAPNHSNGYDPLDKALQGERSRLKKEKKAWAMQKKKSGGETPKGQTPEERYRRRVRQLLTQHLQVMADDGFAYSFVFHEKTLHLAVALTRYGKAGRVFVEVERVRPECEAYFQVRPTDELVAVNDKLILEPSRSRFKELLEAIHEREPRPVKLTFIMGEKRDDVFRQHEVEYEAEREAGGPASLVPRSRFIPSSEHKEEEALAPYSQGVRNQDKEFLENRVLADLVEACGIAEREATENWDQAEECAARGEADASEQYARRANEAAERAEGSYDECQRLILEEPHVVASLDQIELDDCKDLLLRSSEAAREKALLASRAARSARDRELREAPKAHAAEAAAAAEEAEAAADELVLLFVRRVSGAGSADDESTQAVLAEKLKTAVFVADEQRSAAQQRAQDAAQRRSQHTRDKAAAETAETASRLASIAKSCAVSAEMAMDDVKRSHEFLLRVTEAANFSNKALESTQSTGPNRDAAREARRAADDAEDTDAEAGRWLEVRLDLVPFPLNECIRDTSQQVIGKIVRNETEAQRPMSEYERVLDTKDELLLGIDASAFAKRRAAKEKRLHRVFLAVEAVRKESIRALEAANEADPDGEYPPRAGQTVEALGKVSYISEAERDDAERHVDVAAKGAAEAAESAKRASSDAVDAERCAVIASEDALVAREAAALCRSRAEDARSDAAKLGSANRVDAEDLASEAAKQANIATKQAEEASDLSRRCTEHARTARKHATAARHDADKAAEASVAADEAATQNNHAEPDRHARQASAAAHAAAASASAGLAASRDADRDAKDVEVKRSAAERCAGPVLDAIMDALDAMARASHNGQPRGSLSSDGPAAATAAATSSYGLLTSSSSEMTRIQYPKKKQPGLEDDFDTDNFDVQEAKALAAIAAAALRRATSVDDALEAEAAAYEAIDASLKLDALLSTTEKPMVRLCADSARRDAIAARNAAIELRQDKKIHKDDDHDDQRDSGMLSALSTLCYSEAPKERGAHLSENAAMNLVRPGVLVRLRPYIANPIHGWQGLTDRSKVGVVVEITNHTDVSVAFAGLDSAWYGDTTELEVVQDEEGDLLVQAIHKVHHTYLTDERLQRTNALQQYNDEPIPPDVLFPPTALPPSTDTELSLHHTAIHGQFYDPPPPPASQPLIGYEPGATTPRHHSSYESSFKSFSSPAAY